MTAIGFDAFFLVGSNRVIILHKEASYQRLCFVESWKLHAYFQFEVINTASDFYT